MRKTWKTTTKDNNNNNNNNTDIAELLITNKVDIKLFTIDYCNKFYECNNESNFWNIPI